MKTWASLKTGFTIVELLIVVVVVAILAAIIVVAYNGITRQASDSQVRSVIKEAGKAAMTYSVKSSESQMMELPAEFKSPDSVVVDFIPYSSTKYSDLSTVQNGVLFHNICAQLISDPRYSVISSADGSQTSNVVMSCDNSIQDDALLITGWDSMRWGTPLQKSSIQEYLNGLEDDSYWVNKKDKIRSFYNTLMAMYTSSGGTWPIDSFWDHWSNQWSGVAREDLPPPTINSGFADFCIRAFHKNTPETSYIVTADNMSPRTGTCF